VQAIVDTLATVVTMLIFIHKYDMKCLSIFRTESGFKVVFCNSAMLLVNDFFINEKFDFPR